VQLLYDYNHFHSQYIWICVFLLQVRGSDEGRQRLLVLLSPGGIRIEQFVTNCGGERLPCNHLYVISVTFMSVTVQCLYTLLIYVLLLLYALAFHRLALDVVHNILNMQRYVTSVAGQAASVVRRRREAANISASMKTFNCYETVRQFYPSDMATLAWPTSRVGKTYCENVWTTTGFCDMKNLPKSLSRHKCQKITFKTKIALKTFRSAMIYFEFERTAETISVPQNCRSVCS